MRSVFIFVKQRDSVLNVNLAAAARKTGAEVIGVESLDDFEDTLQSQKQDHSIQKLTIWSHGEPGVLDFRGYRFDVGAIRRFNGKGFADLFADDARIIFDGCQVGAGAKGRDFVKEVARVFLSTGGGRASARSEFVLSAPIFTSEVFSLSGMDVHALTNKGGLKVRIGLGNELKSPEGDWHIREDSNKWMYRFFGNGTVRYQDEKKFWGRMNILDLEETPSRSPATSSRARSSPSASRPKASASFQRPAGPATTRPATGSSRAKRRSAPRGRSAPARAAITSRSSSTIRASPRRSTPTSSMTKAARPSA
jgi:hypothetical protein